MSDQNFNIEQDSEKDILDFSSPNPEFNQSDKHKRNLVILAVILIVFITIMFVVVFMAGTKNKNDNQQLVDQNSAVEKQRLGKMYFAAEKSVVRVGEQFEVDVVMDTSDLNIVVGSAKIFYDNNILELVEVNNDLSVLTMAAPGGQDANWVEVVRSQPGDGNYVDADDGYNGEHGILTTLIFKAKQSGTATLYFDEELSGMNLDDGQGTLMNVKFEQAQINIK